MYKWHVMYKKHCYDCDKRISLKTTFFVKSPSSPSIFPSLMRTFVEFWETPLDKATYNWPWLKTWRGRSILTLGMVYPLTLIFAHTFVANLFFRGFKVQYLTLYFAHVCY